MKQMITLEQLNDLTPRGRKSLRNWLARDDGDNEGYRILPCLTVSEMTEFLGAHGGTDDQKLCDELWEQVRHILNSLRSKDSS